MRRTLFLAGWILFASGPRADNGADLLHAVSNKYESLASYEFDGTLSTSLPGTDCSLEFPISVAAAPPAFPAGIQFGSGRKLSKACMDAVTKVGSLALPGEWSRFNTLNVGVKAVNELPTQILRFTAEEIPCVALEVRYDDYYQKIRGYDGPVRYWIDSETLLIRRVQFKERTEHGSRLWTATLEKVGINGPTASWLAKTQATSASSSPLIGKTSPDFQLRTVDGKLVHLAELRGKVVVLDFWATWCGTCDEEIPILENIQAEQGASEVALFGVTEESASDVREWLSQYKRSFLTLVDAKKTFDDFGIKPIPILVLINRHGVVVEYEVGFQSERLVRGLITKHLSD